MTKGYVKIVRSATVNGRQFEAGDMLEIDAAAARELFARGAAVPCPAPGERAMYSVASRAGAPEGGEHAPVH